MKNILKIFTCIFLLCLYAKSDTNKINVDSTTKKYDGQEAELILQGSSIDAIKNYNGKSNLENSLPLPTDSSATTILHNMKIYEKQKKNINWEIKKNSYTESDFLKWFYMALIKSEKIPPNATIVTKSDIAAYLNENGFEPPNGWQFNNLLTANRITEILGNRNWITSGNSIFSVDGIFIALNSCQKILNVKTANRPVTIEDEVLIKKTFNHEKNENVTPISIDIEKKSKKNEPIAIDNSPVQNNIKTKIDRIEKKLDKKLEEEKFTQKKFVIRVIKELNKRGRTFDIPITATVTDYANAFNEFGLIPYDGWNFDKPISTGIIKDFLNKPDMVITSSIMETVVAAVSEALGADTISINGVAAGNISSMESKITIQKIKPIAGPPGFK